MTAPPEARRCPFCEASTTERSCQSCKRDTTAPRGPCQSCGRMKPTAEPRCWHCGGEVKSDLRWKIPLIIVLFLAAMVLSILLHLA